jgi:hypothetical protein
MTDLPAPKDLIVLVADKNMEYTLKGVLSRPPALGIRPITFDVNVHIERDPGCFQSGPNFLRGLVNRYQQALVVFDREGSGQEYQTREALENDLEQRLAAAGWQQRAAAIVIDPELDVWIWSDSPHVDRILGWANRQPDLRTYLRVHDWWPTARLKPDRPKEAVEQALRIVKKPRSSAVYLQLAETVSFQRCNDAAFLKLKASLQRWFLEKQT